MGGKERKYNINNREEMDDPVRNGIHLEKTM